MKYWQVVAMTDMEEIPALALKAEATRPMSPAALRS